MQTNQLAGWPSPSVLPWRVWLNSFYLLARPGAPAMLSTEQALLLWEQIVSEEKDISIEQVSQFTRLAADAWATQHLWRIPVAQLNASNSSFEVSLYAKWQRQFIARCRELEVSDCYQALRHLESVFKDPELRDVELAHLNTKNLLVGYPSVPPLLAALAPYCWSIEKSASTSLAVASRTSPPVELSANLSKPPPSYQTPLQNYELCTFEDEAAELEAAVAWAVDSKLAAPHQVVAIALSNPNMLRDSMQQGIRRYCAKADSGKFVLGKSNPGKSNPGKAAAEKSSTNESFPAESKGVSTATPNDTTRNDNAITAAVNIALVKKIATLDQTPLGSTKLLQSALRILRFSGPVPCDDVSAVLTDPYLGDWTTERTARALLDRDLRAEIRELRLTEGFVLAQLRREEYGLSDFADKVQALCELRDAAPHRMSIIGWHEHFEAQLAVFSWPNNNFVVEDEHTALDAWQHALDTFVSLSAYSGVCTRHHALHRLASIIQQRNFETLYTHDAIRVVGIDEVSLFAPDVVAWCGLGQYQWPIAAQINPLLPHSAQSKAGVPGSNAAKDSELAFNSLVSAVEAVANNRFSFTCRLGDIENAPITFFGCAKDVTESQATADDLEQVEFSVESKEDSTGLALATDSRLKSAVRFFADQAACPFRAYAVHRLGSQSIEEPKLGLDARRRGELVHLAIAALWSSLKSHDTLTAMSENDTHVLIDSVVTETVEQYRQTTRQLPHYWTLESRRLKHLLGEWLEVERARDPFSVAGIEEEFDARVGEFHFKIRVDRIDKLDDESLAVIDFKTGQDTRGSWASPRIDQPQLPIYAVNFVENRIAAVAYAQIRSGECKLVDLPKSRLFKDISDDSWQEQMREWRYDLYATAEQIERGDARVDPKRGAATCRYCEQRLVCRISDTRDDEPQDHNAGYADE